MKEKKITVIIPFYKVENQLERCLNSVLEQTYKNIEIICVGVKNDSRSISIVETYCKKNKNIKLTYQDGKGVGNARNKGIELAEGDYILFLDGDDYIEKDCVELLYSRLKQDKSDMVCCGFERVDDISGKVYSTEMTSMNYDELNIYNDNFFEIAFIAPCPWGKLINKKIIKNVRFSDKPIAGEDLVFFLQIIENCHKISFVKKVLWHYVVRENSLIFDTTETKALDLKDALVSVRKSYSDNNKQVEHLKTIDFIAFLHLGISMSQRIFHKNSKSGIKYLKLIKKELNKNFVYWDKVKIRVKNKLTLKCMILNFARFLLKINCLGILIMFYNFIISKLKIDIKW